MQAPSFSRDAYSVGIVCALTIEQATIEAVLDEEHSRHANSSGDDDNIYTLGKIGVHNIVVA